MNDLHWMTVPTKKSTPPHRGVHTVHADITWNQHSAISSSHLHIFTSCKVSPPVASSFVRKCVQKSLATALPGLENSSLVPFQLQASLHSFYISFQQIFLYFFFIFSSILSCRQHGKMLQDSRDPGELCQL